MPNPTDAASASTRTGLALTLPMIRPHSQVSTVAAAITQTSGRLTGS